MLSAGYYAAVEQRSPLYEPCGDSAELALHIGMVVYLVFAVIHIDHSAGGYIRVAEHFIQSPSGKPHRGRETGANLYFRFPETFTGMLALSGIYTGEYGFGSYMDELVYANSPVHYLENMPADHPYIDKINNNYGIICVGLGPWEVPETSLRLREIFYRKGINVWVDVWGHDVAHDWPWWYKQVEYFVPKLLEA